MDFQPRRAAPSWSLSEAAGADPRKGEMPHVPLAGLEVRPQVGLSQRIDLKLAPPPFEDFRRRAVIEAGIDLAAPADTAALDVGDLRAAEGDGEPAVAVFLLQFPRGKRRAGFERKKGTVLDEHDIATGLGEQAGRDASAGAGADHGDFTAHFRGRIAHHAGVGGLGGGRGARGETFAAVQAERDEAFVEADEVALDRQRGIFPGGDLARAQAGRLAVKKGAAEQAERVEAGRRGRERLRAGRRPCGCARGG